MEENKPDIEQELYTISPLLQEKLPTMDMPVPEGYFQQLEQDILKKTVYAPKRKIVTLRTAFIVVSSAAAIVAIVLFAPMLWQRNSTIPPSFDEQIALISAAELEAYINAHIHEIETDLLFASDYVPAEAVDAQYAETVNAEMLHQETETTSATSLSQESNASEQFFEQLDDETLQDLLQDESLFEDLGL
jgi:hypothetical protein